MSLLRSMYLTTTIGIGGCLCANFADKWQKSFGKVNAQFKVDEVTVIAEGNFLPKYESVKVNPPADKNKIHWTPYNNGGQVFPHPEVPNRSLLGFKDYVLSYDNLTRTASWTLEHVTKENAKPMKEFPVLQKNDNRIPQQFLAGNDLKKALEKLKNLLAPLELLHSEGAGECGGEKQDQTPKSKTLWNEFYDYIVHLTKHHPNLYILSGALYLPTCKPDGKWFVHYELLGSKKVAIPSHFYKVILAENNDGTFRFECFKFENKVHDNKDLSEYHIQRHELEKDTGFVIFSAVPDCKISEEELEPGFAKRYCQKAV